MASRIHGLWWAAFVAGLGCVREVAPPVVEDLSGLTAPLVPSAALKLAIHGQVGSTPAEVRLDLAAPLSRVADACFTARPSQVGVVRVPQLQGGFAEWVTVRLRDARVGHRPLAARDVGLDFEAKACVLWLGSDVLLDYAVEIDPPRRKLRFVRSRPSSAYPQTNQGGDEVRRLQLERDPKTDWPLLAVRLTQDEAALTGAFVLSTLDTRSHLSDAAAREVGLKSAADLLEGVPLPPGVSAPALERTYALDEVELAPSWGLRHTVFRGQTQWSNPMVLGTLGADVWGRFHSTLDLRAGVWLLRRPKLTPGAGAPRCGPGEGREEQCFGVQVNAQPKGVQVVGTVWRELPTGGRLYLEPLDERGERLRADCWMGIAFAPVDRGITSQHLFPWPQLERSSPMCFQKLAAMKSVRPAHFEEGGLKECPGHCGFVLHLPSGRLDCDCQPGAGGAEAQLQFLQLYQQLLEQRQVPVSPGPDEPEDP